MKILDALLVQKELAEEVANMKATIKEKAYVYRQYDKEGEWVPNFDLEAQQEKIRSLGKLHRRLSRAIAKANLSTDIEVNEEDYSPYL